MKKILFFLMGMLMSISIFSQSGATCGSAISFSSTNSCINNNTLSGTEMWFSFVADSTNAGIIVYNSSDTTLGYISNIEVYTNSCSPLILQFSGSTMDDTITFLVCNSLVIGATYNIKLTKNITQNPTSAPFNICILEFNTHTPSACVITSCQLIANGTTELNGGAWSWAHDNFRGGQVDCWYSSHGSPQLIFFDSPVSGTSNMFMWTRYNSSLSELSGEGVATNTNVLANKTYFLSYYYKRVNRDDALSGLIAVNTVDNIFVYLTQSATSGIIPLNPVSITTIPSPPVNFLADQQTSISNSSWQQRTVCFTADNNNYNQIYLYPLANTTGNTFQGIYVDDVSLSEITVDAGADINADCGVFVALNANVVCPNPSYTYSWLPTTGLSNPTISNPTLIATSSITYTVTVTIPGISGCSVSDNISVLVNPISLNADADGDVIICYGESTPLIATSSGSISYNWTPSSGLSCTTCANPIATPSATTTYTVTATNPYGCTETDQITITVNPLPTFTISGSFTSCVQSGGLSTPYSVVPSTGASVAYAYTTSTGASGFATSVNLNFYPNGGTVTFVATDLITGCTYTQTMYVGSCCEPSVNPIISFTNSNTTAMASYSTPPLGSFVSGAFTITGFTIAINGTFIVDQNLTLKGCRILMGYNAKIIVDPTKTLTITSASTTQKSHVYACNEMWDGIYVQNASSLVIINNGSTVEDAMNMIVSENKGNYRIYSSPVFGNVILNKNHKTIVVKNGLSGTHPGYVRSTTIQCYDGVFGGNPSVTSNTLHFPHATERSFIGMEISNINNITIGIPVAIQKNTFDNMDFGIKSTNSSLNVFNNDFKNITAVGAIPKGVECTVGTAICATGGKTVIRTLNVGNASPIPFYKNTFTNDNKGVVATQFMNSNIWKNDFNIITSTGVRLSKNATNVIVVSENEINNARVGIDCFDNQSANVTIDNNDIDAGTLLVASGVLAQEIIAGTTVYKITRNTIKNVRYGAYGIGLKNSDISRNDVNLKHTTSPILECYGIRLANSSLCTVVSNRVYGTNTVDYWVQGISLDLCMSDYVTCNESHNLGTGMFFGGVQTPNTYIAKNLMNNNYRGFVLNFGEVGDQFTPNVPTIKPNDNRWTGIFTSGCYTEAYFSDGNLSKFFVRPGGLPFNVTPVSLNCITGVGSNPIPFFSTTSGINPIVCTSIFPGGGSPAPKPLLLQIAGDSIVPVVYDLSTRWMLKQSLYQHLKVDPSTISTEPLIAQFQSDYSVNNMGKLDDVETILSDLTTATPSSLSSVQSLNNTVVPVSDVETNSKWMNNLLIENALTGSDYSASQISDLQTLAAKCPYNDGQAVYQARVILSQIEDVEYLNACETATPGSHSMSPFSQPEEQSVYNDFKLFPNPNDGTMNFIYSLKETSQGEMVIYDLTGKVVAKYSLATGLDNQILINETQLSNGVYFYKVIIDNEIKVSDKIVIIK